MLKLQTLFYQCLDVLRTNSGTSESHIPSVPTKLNELTKNWKYYFLFMCLLYWPLQNAIYQFCQHSSKLLRIQSMDFYIGSKDGVCAQIHLVCILNLIFFFSHVKSVFSNYYHPWKLTFWATYKYLLCCNFLVTEASN